MFTSPSFTNSPGAVQSCMPSGNGASSIPGLTSPTFSPIAQSSTMLYPSSQRRASLSPLGSPPHVLPGSASRHHSVPPRASAAEPSPLPLKTYTVAPPKDSTSTHARSNPAEIKAEIRSTLQSIDSLIDRVHSLVSELSRVQPEGLDADVTTPVAQLRSVRNLVRNFAVSGERAQPARRRSTSFASPLEEGPRRTDQERNGSASCTDQEISGSASRTDQERNGSASLQVGGAAMLCRFVSIPGVTTEAERRYRTWRRSNIPTLIEVEAAFAAEYPDISIAMCDGGALSPFRQVVRERFLRSKGVPVAPPPTDLAQVDPVAIAKADSFASLPAVRNRLTDLQKQWETLVRSSHAHTPVQLLEVERQFRNQCQAEISAIMSSCAVYFSDTALQGSLGRRSVRPLAAARSVSREANRRSTQLPKGMPRTRPPFLGVLTPRKSSSLKEQDCTPRSTLTKPKLKPERHTPVVTVPSPTISSYPSDRDRASSVGTTASNTRLRSILRSSSSAT